MVDDVHAVGLEPEPLDELATAVVRVDDQRVDPLIEPALGGGLTRAGLAREQVVRGEHKRPRRQQRTVEPRHIEPLEVRDIGTSAQPPVAEHVRHVFKQLARLARARTGATAGVAIEVLADRVPLGRRHVAVGKPARHEPYARSRPGECRAQRVVVGRCER